MFLWFFRLGFRLVKIGGTQWQLQLKFSSDDKFPSEFDTIAGEVRASGSASAIEAGWMGLGCYSTASSGALTRGVCSEAPKQSFKPFFKALKESKSRGDWCLRCKSFIEPLDVFLGTRFIRSSGLRILKGCLGLSKTVISGRLVHDWRG